MRRLFTVREDVLEDVFLEGVREDVKMRRCERRCVVL